MSLEFFTGFEGCRTTVDVQRFFDHMPSLDYAHYSATGGYNNGKCCRSADTSANWGFLVYPSRTKVVGFHVNNCDTALYTSFVKDTLLFFYGPDIRIFNKSSGLEVRYGTSTVIGSCGTKISTSRTHVEIKLYSHPTAGIVQIKLDGELVLNLTGVNTNGTDCNLVMWGCARNASHYIDNIYVADDWQGELISLVNRPIADISTDFTPSSGSDNFAMIDEETMDSDTTYVASSTVGHQDIYGYEISSNIAEWATEKGITSVTIPRKTDSGSIGLMGTVQRNGVNYDVTDFNATNLALTTAYPVQTVYTSGRLRVHRTLNLLPDGKPFTRQRKNALGWGFKII